MPTQQRRERRFVVLRIGNFVGGDKKKKRKFKTSPRQSDGGEPHQGHAWGAEPRQGH